MSPARLNTKYGIWQGMSLARLLMVSGPAGDGIRPGWRWYPARLEMVSSLAGDGIQPGWRWYLARLEMVFSIAGDMYPARPETVSGQAGYMYLDPMSYLIVYNFKLEIFLKNYLIDPYKLHTKFQVSSTSMKFQVKP